MKKVIKVKQGRWCGPWSLQEREGRHRYPHMWGQGADGQETQPCPSMIIDFHLLKTVVLATQFVGLCYGSPAPKYRDPECPSRRLHPLLGPQEGLNQLDVPDQMCPWEVRSDSLFVRQQGVSGWRGEAGGR